MVTKGYHIAILTTLFSILLWGSVKLGGQYQSIRTIQVTIPDLPEGMAPSKPLPRSLKITLRGEGWSLAGDAWNGTTDIRLDILSAESAPLVYTLTDIREVLDLGEGLELVSMKPDSISVRLEPAMEKRVPVIFTGSPRFADGYGLSGAAQVSPDSVTVQGAIPVVETITSWEASFPATAELRSSVDEQVGVVDPTIYFVTVSPESVSVRLNIQPLAEKNIEGIPVAIQFAPHDREVILIPPKVDLLIRGPIDQLSSIRPEECQVTVDYSTIVLDTLRFVIPTVALPQGLTVIARTPDRLQFVVRERLIPHDPALQKQ